MDVRFQFFRLSSAMLISFPALPTVQCVTLGGGLYMTGDLSALTARFSGNITPIVSLRFHLATHLLTPFPGVRIRRALNSFGWL
jgi:hypothetical protein